VDRRKLHQRVFAYLELEKTLLISTNMSFLTFLRLIAERRKKLGFKKSLDTVSEKRAKS